MLPCLAPLDGISVLISTSFQGIGSEAVFLVCTCLTYAGSSWGLPVAFPSSDLQVPCSSPASLLPFRSFDDEESLTTEAPRFSLLQSFPIVRGCSFSCLLRSSCIVSRSE